MFPRKLNLYYPSWKKQFKTKILKSLLDNQNKSEIFLTKDSSMRFTEKKSQSTQQTNLFSKKKLKLSSGIAYLFLARFLLSLNSIVKWKPFKFHILIFIYKIYSTTTQKNEEEKEEEEEVKKQQLLIVS